MYYGQMADYLFGRIGLHDWRKPLRDEHGAISTETAVVTFLLVSIAVGVGAVMWAAADSQAGQIPTDVPDPTN